MKTPWRLLFTYLLVLFINSTPALSDQGCPVLDEAIVINQCPWIPISFNQAALSDMVGQFYLNQYPGGLYGSSYGTPTPPRTSPTE
ncbi:MAG TPA: hypothetical protein VFA68_17920 [Terriglobales bacterium]|nr:hypothetical protein [Terriglobales bacterium]